MTTLAKRLKRALDVREMTQYALARSAGLTRGHISKLVSGKKLGEPQYSTVVNISRALRIDPEWLVKGVGEPPSEEDVAPDPLENRSEAFRIGRDGGVRETVLQAIAREPPSGSEAWSTFRWIGYIQFQMTVLGETMTPPTGSAPASRLRTRANISELHPAATAKKK